MTKIYLAWAQVGHETLAHHAHEKPIDVLVAFPLLRFWEKMRKDYNVRSWSLDSGAFSVWKSGKRIELDDYIAACRDVDADEVFGLDVINDHVGTQRNLERMWEQGVQAIPTFHQGSPWESLDWACANAKKIAISGKKQNRAQWIEQCFKRAWPKLIHGFAFASDGMIGLGPFDSVDSCSWEFGPLARGSWAGYNGGSSYLGTRVNSTYFKKDCWVEVQAIQRRAEYWDFRWRNQLAQVRS